MIIMHYFKKITLATAISLASISTGVQAQTSGVELGQLNCTVKDGIGFIFGSSKALTCRFTPANNELPVEEYTGRIEKFGLDIGYTETSEILWTVVAAENFKSTPGQLAGEYAGATASASIGVGLGANVLVGGSQDSIALQPVSISGESGYNIAAGIAQIKLR